MTCLSDGLLQTYVDREMAAPELEEVQQHLASCVDCRRRLESVTRSSALVSRMLSTLSPTPAQSTDPAIAYPRFRATLDEQSEAKPSWFSRVFARPWRPAWGALAVALIVLVLGFSPARTWAERLLATLRVKRIAVIAFDPESFSRAEQNDPRFYKLLEKTIADTVVVTKQPEKRQIFTNTSTASQLAGFRIRTLKDLAGPQEVQVNSEVAFHLTIDRERLVNVLDEIGRADIQIANAVDGATVSVHIPKTVFSMYGNCQNWFERRPRPEEDSNEVPSDPSRSDCTLLVQAPSPTVTVPPNLNMSDIVEAGLQLAGMSAGEAHALCSTVDWTSTLVIPVPRKTASYRPVFVDGVEGTLIEMQNEQNRYNLLWTKNGVIYSLNGNGTMNDALALAASLR
jgi:Putative zinc-finger/Domain of unknown function (DUF4367)